MDVPSNLPDVPVELPIVLETRHYAHQDEQMTVHALTDKDGVIQQGYMHDPYGGLLVFTAGTPGKVVWSTSGDIVSEDAADALTPFLYTGRRYDPESGLYYYRSRHMSPEMGRFISSDTIGVWGDPLSLGNGYAIAANHPIDARDPCGTSTMVCEPCESAQRAVNSLFKSLWGGIVGLFSGPSKDCKNAREKLQRVLDHASGIIVDGQAFDYKPRPELGPVDPNWYENHRKAAEEAKRGLENARSNVRQKCGEDVNQAIAGVLTALGIAASRFASGGSAAHAISLYAPTGDAYLVYSSGEVA